MRVLILSIVCVVVICSSVLGENWFCSSLGHDALINAGNRWEGRDGGVGFVVSDQFLLLLAACPGEFYGFMKTRPKILSTWLGEVENFSGFTNSTEEKQKREILLSKLVIEIKRSSVPSGETAIRKQILDTLEVICVRAVDHASPTPPCHRIEVAP